MAEEDGFQVIFSEPGIGTWTKHSTFRREGGRAIIEKLVVEVDLMPGDHPLLGLGMGDEFLVSASLASVLRERGLTGFETRPVELVQGEQFHILYRGRSLAELQPYFWLHVHGVGFQDDIGRTQSYPAVSKRFVEALEGFSCTEIELRPPSHLSISTEDMLNEMMEVFRKRREAKGT